MKEFDTADPSGLVLPNPPNQKFDYEKKRFRELLIDSRKWTQGFSPALMKGTTEWKSMETSRRLGVTCHETYRTNVSSSHDSSGTHSHVRPEPTLTLLSKEELSKVKVAQPSQDRPMVPSLL